MLFYTAQRGVCLYNQSMEHIISPRKSQKLTNIIAILRLGAIIVNFRFDHYFDHEAVKNRLQRSIQRLRSFSPTQQDQLEVYFLRKVQQPEHVALIKAEIALLDHQQQTQISRILVKIIFADGDIPLSNVNQDNLKHLYLTLGLEREMLTTALALLFPENTVDADFSLDMAAVEAHQVHTKAAQAVLSDVFDATEDKNPVKHAMNEANNNVLDTKHQRLYRHLTGKTLWSNEELKTIAIEYQLPMIHGMIEKINRWACEHVDYSVFIKDKNGISVDTEMVKDINNKTG